MPARPSAVAWLAQLVRPSRSGQPSSRFGRPRGPARGADWPAAIGLIAGAVLDQLVADPRRGHPVAIFGSAAGRLESRLWRDDRVTGSVFAAGLVGSAALLGAAATRLPGPLRALSTALAAWAVLGGRSLRREATAVNALLDKGDLVAARQRLQHLVGRRTDELTPAEVARAAVESVAENTCDAVGAPLLWGAVGGIPGLLAYRAINTLDAMVGHHSPRYERFGWASARADDLANYLPARVTALLTATAAPLVGGRPASVLAVVRRDGRHHPSPNAGMCEASFAGALGIRLGGRNDYGGRVEDRPRLGDGRPAQPGDIARAARLSAAVGAETLLAGAVITLLRKTLPRPGRGRRRSR